MHINPIWPKGRIESICPLGNIIDAWTSCTAQGTYRYAWKSRYGVKVLPWVCNLGHAHQISHCTPNFIAHCTFSLHIVHFHCTLYLFITHCTFTLHIVPFHCSLHILYCCSSSCGTLTAEPLLSNSRVASVKQVVIAIIIIIINQNPSTLSTGRNTNTDN